jgi:hypothetical protein
MKNESPCSLAPPPSSPLGEASALPVNPDASLFINDDDEAERLDYNPEEYRWVPVRRRPRYDGWTEEKQRRFIEALADTGLVSSAAKAVGMSRESANRLRRAPHGAAFARAWDAARQHAGAALEDIAFERAIEGVEQNVYNEYGEVIATKRLYNDRLLTFLLRHLKPERYASDALAVPALAASVDEALRAMEPPLPAPPVTMLGIETMEHELKIAEAGDGILPTFLSEQRPPESAAREQAEAIAAQHVRADAILSRLTNKKPGETVEVSHQDEVDITRSLDPTSWRDPPQKRFR